MANEPFEPSVQSPLPNMLEPVTPVAPDFTKMEGPLPRMAAPEMAVAKTFERMADPMVPTINPFSDDNPTLTGAQLASLQTAHVAAASIDPQNIAPTEPAKPEGRYPSAVVAAAKNSEQKWGIPASVTLAQWALETGYGKSMPKGSNNPFGIKAREGQDFVLANTHERIGGRIRPTVAAFAKYGSIDEAFDEHGRLLAQSKVYKMARATARNPQEFATKIAGRYATDRGYGQKLLSIMHAEKLYVHF